MGYTQSDLDKILRNNPAIWIQGSKKHITPVKNENMGNYQQNNNDDTIGNFVRITIDGELPGLNEIVKESKQHFAVYSKIKKRYTEKCAGAAEGLMQIKSKVDIDITWYTKDNKKDPDNIAAGIKYILDGFVTAGLLQGDGRKNIGKISHEFETDKINPRIEVKIKEAIG